MPAKCSIEEKLDRRVRRGKPDECWPFIGAQSRQGYGNINHRGKTILAHRVAYEVAFAVEPSESIVMHKCDNPACCNPAHLVLGTVGENNRDRHSKGRSRGGINRGTDNPSAKITPDQAREIFLDWRPHNWVAEKYGLTFQTVYCIRARKSWRHVTEGLECGYHRWQA